MRIHDIMSKKPVTATPEMNVQVVAQVMQDEDVGMVPVVRSVEDQHLVGVLTDRDIAIRVVAEGRDILQTTVGQVMSEGKVVCCDGDTHIDKAMHLMSTEQIRRLPITDKAGKLVGIVSQADLALHADKRKAAETVSQISQPGGPHHQ